MNEQHQPESEFLDERQKLPPGTTNIMMDNAVILNISCREEYNGLLELCGKTIGEYVKQTGDEIYLSNLEKAKQSLKAQFKQLVQNHIEILEDAIGGEALIQYQSGGFFSTGQMSRSVPRQKLGRALISGNRLKVLDRFIKGNKKLAESADIQFVAGSILQPGQPGNLMSSQKGTQNNIYIAAEMPGMQTTSARSTINLQSEVNPNLIPSTLLPNTTSALRQKYGIGNSTHTPAQVGPNSLLFAIKGTPGAQPVQTHASNDGLDTRTQVAVSTKIGAFAASIPSLYRANPLNRVNPLDTLVQQQILQKNGSQD